jgi:hypothetical protein
MHTAIHLAERELAVLRLRLGLLVFSIFFRGTILEFRQLSLYF